MQAAHSSRPAFEVPVTAIMLFQVTALFARSMLELALVRRGFGRPVAADLSYLVVPALLLPLMCPYLARCGASLRALLRPADLTLRVFLAGAALGLVLRLLRWSTNTLLVWLGVRTNDDPNAIVGPVIGFECPDAGFLLLSFAVMSVLIPVTEEVVNRGFILHALLPRGRILAIVISALLFAALHPPSAWMITFAVGMVLAVQTLNFRTLWASMFTHATYNAAAVIDWECLRITWHPPPGDPALRMLALAATGITAIGAFLVCRLVSRKTAGRPCARRRPALIKGRSPPVQ